MKNTIKITTLAAAMIFSGAAAAGKYTDQQAEDIFHGMGIDSANPAQAFDRDQYDPRGYNQYLMYNLDAVEPRMRAPFDPNRDDRDNRDNVRDMQS